MLIFLSQSKRLILNWYVKHLQLNYGNTKYRNAQKVRLWKPHTLQSQTSHQPPPFTGNSQGLGFLWSPGDVVAHSTSRHLHPELVLPITRLAPKPISASGTFTRDGHFRLVMISVSRDRLECHHVYGHLLTQSLDIVIYIRLCLLDNRICRGLYALHVAKKRKWLIINNIIYKVSGTGSQSLPPLGPLTVIVCSTRLTL